jgi:ankyrin repeat protein
MSSSFRLGIAFLAVLAASLAGCAHQPGDLHLLDTERLHNAIVADDAGYVEAALRGKAVSANRHIPALGYREGVPLLTVAARNAALGVIRVLLAAGADVNARTPDGDTALMLASFFFSEDRDRGLNTYEQHEKAVRLLVAAGAHIENEPHHYTPLGYAAYQAHDRIVRFLIERGARLDGDADQASELTYVNTPLMLAAIQGNHGTSLVLLRHGANARIRVRGGRTAAEFAESYRHPALARVLRCAEGVAPGEVFSHRCEAAQAVNQ